MSILPTAHASLGFGRRTVEFYAINGHVAAPERRAKGQGRSILSADGERHALRLPGRAASALEDGETVTVLRMQSGPNREARPVAAINHDRREWTRTAPDATSLLSRAGVTRGLNWILSIFVLIMAAIAVAWPDLRAFLLEVAPGVFGAAPPFDLSETLVALAPALAEWRPAALLPADFAASLEANEAVGDRLDALICAILLLALGLLAFAGRSWRFIWIPLYVALAVAVGLALAAPSPVTPALAALTGLMGLFVLGGLVNRIRDSARFEARVTRLSEHLLRHPPQESVGPARAPAPAYDAAPAAALAAAPALEAVAEAEVDVVEPEAAFETESAGLAAETPDPANIDDLPSDEALAAARAALAAESAPLTAEPDAAGRDMVLPPPPPMPEPLDATPAEAPRYAEEAPDPLAGDGEDPMLQPDPFAEDAETDDDPARA